ncbi:MAG: DUF2550 domain-containing protein [Micromonosporaceae bacterium]
MGALGVFGIGVVMLFGLLALMLVRRALIVMGGGAVVMSVRLSARYRGRGWAPGLGRFVGHELRWHRIFSLSIRPRYVFGRSDVQVRSRRRPVDSELLSLPDDCVILRCGIKSGQLDIALRDSALAGFLSWLEAAPPGAASRHVRAR